MGTPDTAQKAPSAGGYRLLAVIAFLLAAGGLFLGLLGAFTGIFQPNFTGSDILADSLFGFVYTYIKGIAADAGAFFGDLFRGGVLEDVITLALVALLCVAVAVSLVLMLVSFFSAKAARPCALTSSVLVFLAYAGFFLLSYYTLARDRGDFNASMIDLSTGAIAGGMLIALVICALVRRKGTGLLNLISFLLLCAAVFGLTYPGSAMLAADVNYTHIGENVFVNLTALLTAALAAFNVIVSAVRLNARRAYAFDAVRFGLLFLAVLLAVIAQIVDLSADVMFNSDNLLPVILALAASLAAFLLAVVLTVSKTAGKQAKQDEAASAEAGERYALAQPTDARQPEGAQQQPAPQPAPQPTAQQTIAAPGTTVIVQSPAPQQPATPIYAVPFFAAPMTPPQQPATAAAPAPAPEPAPAEEKPTPADDAAMSEFERSMAALARGIAPEQTPAQPMPGVSYQYAPPAPQQPAPPAPAYVAAPAAAYQPPYAQPAAKMVYDPTPYTYDPFINMLTPQEKNEFGDLFIANRYGDLAYLPAYVIGGDNREFFRRVFIYLGKFRSHISPELLGKLYQYVSKL